METVEKSSNDNDLYAHSLFDINTLINKDTTALVKVKGNNYSDMFIYKDDIIIADSSIQPFDNSRVIISMSGFLSIKIFRIIDGQSFIQSGKYRFMPLSIGEMQFDVVGIITGVIHNYNDKIA